MTEDDGWGAYIGGSSEVVEGMAFIYGGLSEGKR